MASRTEDMIFSEFKEKHTDDGLRWREHWRGLWTEAIDDYIHRGWGLILCGKYSKRPVAGFKWGHDCLTRDQAIWYAGQGFNIAVYAGEMLILDHDSGVPSDTGTLTMRTPKGYQYFTKGPYAHNDGRTTGRLADIGFDIIRSGTMYSLLPLSRTCTKDKGGTCNCLPGKHDFRIREWLDPKAQVLPFRVVAKRLLKR